MRVRPFFWILLASICTSILIFSGLISTYRSLPMHVYIEQISINGTSPDATTVRLSLTDPEGTPIDQAQIISSAYMRNMDMYSPQISIRSLGSGTYLAFVHFSMSGRWNIDITASANGFNPARQSIQLDV